MRKQRLFLYLLTIVTALTLIAYRIAVWRAVTRIAEEQRTLIKRTNERTVPKMPTADEIADRVAEEIMERINAADMDKRAEQTNATPVSEEVSAESSLSQLRKEAATHGALCAVQRVDQNMGPLSADIYPFLSSAPHIYANGDEQFAVVPVDPLAQVEISHSYPTSDGFDRALDYDSRPGNGNPIIVHCSTMSDFWHTDVAVTDSRNKAVTFSLDEANGNLCGPEDLGDYLTWDDYWQDQGVYWFETDFQE